MKQKIAGIILALAVFVSSVTINTKAVSLKVSESNIEFYPSERHVVVLSSSSDINKNDIKIKSKNINVEIVGCTKTDVDYACLLSFYGFKEAEEEVEIKYDNQTYYVNAKVKSLKDYKESMSLGEQYQMALAKLLTKYHVVSPDDIKDEKTRLDVEKQIEKLRSNY